MTEGEAAPTAAAEPGSRNLLLRVVVALVLAPLAIAIAYAGGWLWAALVTLASIGLFVEWLMIVGVGRERRVVVAGGVALANMNAATLGADTSFEFTVEPAQ